MGWVMLSASFSINPVGIGLGPHVGLIGQRFLTTRSKTKNEPRSVFRQVSTLLFLLIVFLHCKAASCVSTCIKDGTFRSAVANVPAKMLVNFSHDSFVRTLRK